MFEQKRRRAAKLTNFFGVNHRDIVDDILESLETGVAEERGMGTLDQDQADVCLTFCSPRVECLLISVLVQDLLLKVWNLKTRT